MKIIQIKLAILMINLAIRLLPPGYKNKTFIINCIHTKIIKAEIKLIKKEISEQQESDSYDLSMVTL